jgi:hypothetical protein
LNLSAKRDVSRSNTGWSIEMSEPLVVIIPHVLGKDEALRRLQSGMARVRGNIPILTFDEQTWSAIV